MTTNENITDMQIQALASAAGAAGDLAMAAIAQKALTGEIGVSHDVLDARAHARIERMSQAQCRVECARAIATAEAMADA